MSMNNITNTPPVPPKAKPMPSAFESNASQRNAQAASPAMDQSSFEEITMALSSSVESKSKSHEERTLRPRARVEKLKQLYELLGHGKGNEQQETVDRLLALVRQQGKFSDLLDLADKDPAKADILLQLAKGRAKPEEQSVLQALTDQLHQTHGVEVTAGINTASAIAQFSQDPEQRQQIRNVYYQTVVGQASYGAIFDALLQEHDEHHFVHGLHTLIHALNEDLASLYPSIPKERLQALMRDLSSCQQLINILHGCRSLLEDLGKRISKLNNMTPTRLTHRLVQFTQANIYPRELKNLSGDVAGSNLPDQLMFLNRLYLMLDQMPMVIWKEDKLRGSTLNLMKRVMGESAEIEKQQMASQPTLRAQA